MRLNTDKKKIGHRANLFDYLFSGQQVSKLKPVGIGKRLKTARKTRICPRTAAVSYAHVACAWRECPCGQSCIRRCCSRARTVRMSIQCSDDAAESASRCNSCRTYSTRRWACPSSCARDTAPPDHALQIRRKNVRKMKISLMRNILPDQNRQNARKIR